ncbi:MAG: glycine--tRNA ligase subunit beta [Pseudomonadota bacterium]|nr:glycine--tRNA ligase subunit beta [Pseudomonadota bacterium]
MADLLLELLSEEIPARMQVRAAEDLKTLLLEELAGAGLKVAGAVAHSTPRRLVLSVTGIPAAQEDVREERRGPRADAPARAIEGFLGSTGLTREQLEERETPKGSFLFAVIEKKGQATVEVLPALVEAAIHRLPWPKSMRWGANTVRWVRPLQSILCLFDGAVLPVRYGNVQASDVTRGHRHHAPKPFSVSSFDDYVAKLREASVILDREERKQAIDARVRELAAAEGLHLHEDAGLLEEVAGLVEWPVPLVGRIDDSFMDVPAEVLTTSMRTHQKYFALDHADGSLAPRFAVVANMVAEDGGATIIAGNEKVLRARLSDARFFWDQDRARRLDSRLGDLDPIVFHARMGTLRRKAERVSRLAGWLAGFTGAESAAAERAGLLAKADLTTGMVGEFPELQGFMGRYYAIHDGESAVVADAIRWHYSPAGPGDACPTAPVAMAVALADKLDSLAGFFAVGEKPTGSRDPFALRRAALGVIRIVLENNLRLPLAQAFGAAHAGIAGDLVGEAADAATVTAELLDFIADRLRVHLREQGVRHDLITAVFALGGEDDLVRLMARVGALSAFVASDDGANLIVAYRRAANILRIEEKKDGAGFDGPADRAIFAEPAERALGTALTTAAEQALAAVEREDFTAAMAAMATLRAPVDAFFDGVTVNADDPALRANRLKLLAEIRTTLHRVADFARIEGQG